LASDLEDVSRGRSPRFTSVEPLPSFADKTVLEIPKDDKSHPVTPSSTDRLSSRGIPSAATPSARENARIAGRHLREVSNDMWHVAGWALACAKRLPASPLPAPRVRMSIGSHVAAITQRLLALGTNFWDLCSRSGHKIWQLSPKAKVGFGAALIFLLGSVYLLAPTKTSKLQVRCSYPFRSAQLSIWVDDRPTFDSKLIGTHQGGFHWFG